MNGWPTDLDAYFDELWREVSDREVSEPEPLDGKVRLDCSGELVDAGSVPVALVRHTAAGRRIEFVCPRCSALHDSACFA